MILPTYRLLVTNNFIPETVNTSPNQTKWVSNGTFGTHVDATISKRLPKFTPSCQVFPAIQWIKYHIAGNFRMVQNFAYFV